MPRNALHHSEVFAVALLSIALGIRAPAQSGPATLGDLVPGAAGSFPVFLGGVGGSVVFRAQDAARSEELWVSDGSVAGTRRLGPGRPQWAAPLGDGLLVADAMSVPGSYDLLRVDALGRVRPALTCPAPSRWPASELADALVFATSQPSSGAEPWVLASGGAAARPVADLVPGPVGSDPRFFVRDGDSVVFFADDGSPGRRRLFRSDGGAPSPVSQVLPFDRVDRVALAGPRLFVKTISVPSQGWVQSLWSIELLNGAVTQLATATNPPQDPTQFLAAFGDRVVFDWDDPATGREAWISDGSRAGTRLLSDFDPGPASSRPWIQDSGLDGRTVWLAQRGASTHLVSSDGSAQRTTSLVDLGPFWTPTYFVDGPILAAGDDRALVCVLDVRTRFRAVIETDGTPAGTRPFALGFTPHILHGGKLWLADETASSGREPAVTDAGATAERYGWGCGEPTRVPQISSTVPRPGASFQVRGHGAPPNGPSLQVTLAGPTLDLPLRWLGCVLYVDPQLAATVAASATVGGRWGATVPVPPSAHGVRLALQSVVFGGVPGTSGFEVSNAVLLHVAR